MHKPQEDSCDSDYDVVTDLMGSSLYRTCGDASQLESPLLESSSFDISPEGISPMLDSPQVDRVRNILARAMKPPTTKQQKRRVSFLELDHDVDNGWAGQTSSDHGGSTRGLRNRCDGVSPGVMWSESPFPFPTFEGSTSTLPTPVTPMNTWYPRRGATKGDGVTHESACATSLNFIFSSSLSDILQA